MFNIFQKILVKGAVRCRGSNTNIQSLITGHKSQIRKNLLYAYSIENKTIRTRHITNLFITMSLSLGIKHKPPQKKGKIKST